MSGLRVLTKSVRCSCRVGFKRNFVDDNGSEVAMSGFGFGERVP